MTDEHHIGVDPASGPDIMVREMWKRCGSCNGQAYAKMWATDERTEIQRSPCHCGKTFVAVSEVASA